MVSKQKQWQSIHRQCNVLDRHDFEINTGVVTTFIVELHMQYWACTMFNGDVISLETII